MNSLPERNHGNGRQLVPVGETVPALRDPYGRLTLYGTSLGDESEPSGLNVREYLRILNKRKWLIIAIASAFVVISGVRTLMETPLFVSTVRIQIEREARVMETGDIQPHYSDYEFMQTQKQLLDGRAMAQRVVSALKLGNDADFLKPRGFSVIGAIKGLLTLAPSSNGEGLDETAAEDWAIGVVLGNRTVNPVTDARLI